MFLLRPGVGERRRAQRFVGAPLAGLVLVALLACKNKERQPQPEQPVPAQTQEPIPRGNANAGGAAAPPAPPGTLPRVAPQPVPLPALAFTLSRDDIKQGESVKLTFNRPVQPASGQHWVTVVYVGHRDDDWGDWKYVPAGATSIELTPKLDGLLEVRLHDTFPDHKFGVLKRVPLTVRGPKCGAVYSAKCTCPGGVESRMTCSETSGWSACDCPKPKPKPKPKVSSCRDGQTRACPCGDGTFGRQTCDRGRWPSGCFLCD